METMQPTPAPPRRSLEALARLGERLRKVLTWDGVASVAGFAVAGVALSFAFDYVLVLPWGVRLCFLLAGAFLLVGLVRKRLIKPLARTVGAVELANLVERVNPELSQSLITAVELTQGGSEAAAHISPSLVDAVVRDVEGRVGSIGFERIFSLTRLRRKTAIVCGSALGMLLLAALNPGLAAIWLSRDVLLSAERWPKETQLTLLKPTPPIYVATGDDVLIEVKVTRGSPTSVVLDSIVDGRLARSEPIVEASTGLFQRRIENVSRPFQFRVRGGDDELGPFDVEVRLRPRIDMQSIRLWCDYPSYTGIPSTPDEEPIRYANLKVPEGTRVRYEMATNVDVSRACWVFRPADASSGSAAAAPVADEKTESDWPDAGAVDLELQGGREFRGSFEVRESGQFYFQLEGADGFRSRKPDRFRVEALKDTPPAVKIVEPERVTEEVSPDARVAIRISAHDDYRIEKATLLGSYFGPGKDRGVEQAKEFSKFSPLAEGDAKASEPAGEKPIEDEVVIEVAAIQTGEATPPVPGARFQFWAEAKDFAGHVGDSQMHFLQVLEKEDILRILMEQLMIVRDQLRDVVRRQASARKDLDDFQRALALREKIPVEEASKLARHRLDQSRVSQALDREARELGRVILRTVRNNVGDEKWKTWVTGLRDDVAALASHGSVQIEKSLETLQKAASREPQDLKPLASVAQAQRDLEREVESIILRLSEFGDKNALIQMLRDLRRRQADLRRETHLHLQGTAPREPQK